MKYFLILITAVTLSFNLFSNSEFGVGFSVENNFTTNGGNGIIAPPNHVLLSSNSNNIKTDVGLMILNVNSSKDDGDTSSTTLDLFAGFYYLSKVDKSLSIYYGAKFGLMGSKKSSSYKDGSNESSIQFFYITPTLGGEYFFVPNFSISGEIGLRVYFDDRYDDENYTSFHLMSAYTLLVKWYF